MKNLRGGEIDDVDLIRDDETLYVYSEYHTKDRVVTENVAIFEKVEPPKQTFSPAVRKYHSFAVGQGSKRELLSNEDDG